MVLCFLSLVNTKQSIHTLSHKHINRHKHLYEADTAALLNRLDNWPHSVTLCVCVCVCQYLLSVLYIESRGCGEGSDGLFHASSLLKNSFDFSKKLSVCGGDKSGTEFIV